MTSTNKVYVETSDSYMHSSGPRCYQCLSTQRRHHLPVTPIHTVHHHCTYCAQSLSLQQDSRVESYSKIMLITAPAERASIKDFVPDQAIVPRLFTRSDPHKTAKNETMKNQNLPNDKTLPNDKEE